MNRRKSDYADALQFFLSTVEKRMTSGNSEATVNAEIEAPTGDNVDEEGDHVQPQSISSGSGFPPLPRPVSRERQSDRFTSFQSALL